MKYAFEQQPDGSLAVDVWKRGHALLTDALLNKGTAFTSEERGLFELEGLLPSGTTTRPQQIKRAYEHMLRKGDHALEKYIGMAALQNRNETLFYQVLAEHLEELLPVVYTPTVGEAAIRFSHIFRRGRGIWITPEQRGRIYDVLGHVRNEEVRLIVVTDNERILGLGDQGAGGMVIPIGKLNLYTVAAGIHPAFTLPVSLDVGTDNPELLADPLYVGWRRPRLRGTAYDELVEEFVAAVQRRFPGALLQWEDFKKGNAFALLERYRHVLPSFNDDIQGTGAVALAGILAASRAQGVKLSDQRVLIVGAGAAGIGIARQLVTAMNDDSAGAEATHPAVAVMDSQGLLIEGRHLEDYKRSFAWPADSAAAIGIGPEAGLVEVIEAVHPTSLIGAAGIPRLFTEKVVAAVARHCERPSILLLSNPTAKAEAHPSDVIRWSGVRALVATGSPFAPVRVGERLIQVRQANNVYVFPGVGLGALVAGARTVTDSMFTAAAHVLAGEVSETDLSQGALFPPIGRLRQITRNIAVAVAKEAVYPPMRAEGVSPAVDAAIWNLDYPVLRPV
ncbi:MAG TPA: NAD-dependent malic enzyme [Acidimicrobiia bacterium]